MSTSIDQKTYLQKYLGGPSVDKKKKKKKVIKGKGIKIIDDDLDVTKLRPLDGDDLDILDQGEDAPQIAGIIDERPEELRKLDQFTSSKWKVINQDDGFNSKLQIQEIKKDVKEKEKENELIFGKMYSDSEDEQKNDSDISPPRKHSKNDKSERKKRPQNNSDSDFSPPRKRDPSSPKKRKEKDYDSDVSPPRSKNDNEIKKRKKPSRWGSVDRSTQRSPEEPKKRKSRKYDSEISPPRKSRRSESPKRPKRKQKDYDSDISPPRKSRKDSPKRKRSLDSDASPPRKRKSPYKDSIQTNKLNRDKRNRSPDSDLSPPRKNKRPQSPNRKGKRQYDSDSDLSPPRKDRDKKSLKRGSDSPPPTNKKMAKTLEGKKAGLQNAVQLRKENDALRKKEDEVFRKMSDEVSGRNAKVVSRKGKRETSEDRQKQREKAERQKELDEKYKKWSKGLKQVEDQEARVQDFLHEASKPLARHKNDRDLEDNLRQIERDGDPMLQYIREKKRERGELPPEKPSYKGNFPPNRFNIRPGYRWDGVDRSNGYEKKFFENQSKRKAQEEEAYKWSTEDL